MLLTATLLHEFITVTACVQYLKLCYLVGSIQQIKFFKTFVKMQVNTSIATDKTYEDQLAYTKLKALCVNGTKQEFFKYVKVHKGKL